MMSHYEREALRLIDKYGRDIARQTQKDTVARLICFYDAARADEAAGIDVGDDVHEFYQDLSFAEGVLEAIDYISVEPGG
jgi:hypothetical protein